MTPYIVPLRFMDKAKADAVAEAVAWADGYQDHIVDPNDETKMIPNPQTKLEFALARVVGFLTSKKQAYDEYLASQNTQQTPTDIGVIH